MDLLGGADKKKDFSDFVDRFEKGKPHEGYDDDEADERHRRVAEHLSPDEYEESATEAFRRMDPDDRREVHRRLRSSARERGVEVDDREDDDHPDRLGGLAGKLHGLDPGMLGSLLGGGKGGKGGKSALAGIAAMAAKKFMANRK